LPVSMPDCLAVCQYDRLQPSPLGRQTELDGRGKFRDINIPNTSTSCAVSSSCSEESFHSPSVQWLQQNHKSLNGTGRIVACRAACFPGLLPGCPPASLAARLPGHLLHWPPACMIACSLGLQPAWPPASLHASPAECLPNCSPPAWLHACLPSFLLA
jgi:hypothetical protein